MATLRILLCFVFALAAALVLPVQAETQAQSLTAAAASGLRSASSNATSRGYLGLNLGRSAYVPCSTISLLCDVTDRPAKLHAGTMVGNFWGVELGYLDTGRAVRAGGPGGAQGLNLSLIGKAPLGRTFGVYGKLGTTLGRPDTSVLGASGTALSGGERGFGLSYGAGVSVAFTRRLSATLEWESNDFRFAGSLGDPVRSTSLGLHYRY